MILATPIGYFDAPDMKRLVDEIVESLGFFHVVNQLVYWVRSRGSFTKCCKNRELPENEVASSS